VVREKVTALSHDLGITEFMLLQAAVAVVLHKAGGSPDIPIGTPVAGRDEPELDQLIGFFINIVVLRNDLRGNPTLREVLQRTREMALAAYAHQDLPFDQVVDAIRPARSLARNPLFDVVVHVRDELPRDNVIASGPGGDTTFSVLEPTFDVAHADMSVNFFASDDGYRGHIIYRPELYKRSTAQRFAEWLVRVIEAFACHPDQPLRELEIAGARERQRILDQSNAGDGVARVYLLDASLRPVPVGVVGDVYHGGGPAVSARLARPSLTASRFVADPFAAQPGSRLYRNGERGVWTDDGQLELLAGQERPAHAAPVTGSAEPPNTATERALAAILAEVLGVGEVGRHDEFFNLGGDSILAVRVAARARDAGMPLTPRMVFEHPVLHELATALDAKSEAETEPENAHHAPMSASGLSADELATLTSTWGHQP
jgi:mycobactin peptide synthetase MbtE